MSTVPGMESHDIAQPTIPKPVVNTLWDTSPQFLGELQDWLLLNTRFDYSSLVNAPSGDFINIGDLGAGNGDSTQDANAVSKALAKAATLTGVPIILFPPGTYLCSVDVPANQQVFLLGQGSVIKPPASGVGIGFTGVNGATAIGSMANGFTVDGANGSVTGLRVTNGDRNIFRNIHVKTCTTALELKNDASGWVEGTVLDNCFFRDGTTGISFNKTATGNTSFGETLFNSVGINNFTTGINVNQNSLLYRCNFGGVTIWQNNSQTGFAIDGNIYGSVMQIGFECQDTGTSVVGVDVKTNADAFGVPRNSFDFKFDGNFASYVQVAASKYIRWREQGDWYQKGGFDNTMWFKSGDSWPRVTLTTESAGGITFGSGTGASDCAIFRNAVNQIQTPDQLQCLDGVQTRYVTGAGKTTVSDADFAVTPSDGATCVHYDTTAAKGYFSVRANGTWRVMGGPV